MDRCIVCHTPLPEAVLTRETDGSQDTDATRLGPPNVPGRSAGGALATAHPRGAPVLQPGQVFANRYTVIRLLGSGGMAAVYQAWDESLTSAVALKLIRVDPSMEASEIRQLEERFKRELKLARQVTHPNVIRIHDLGDVDGTLYLTMACVQGADLSASLRQGRMPIPRALSLGRQIVSGLSAAHRAGVVHRDLKPANILVDGEDRAIITDFGIARSKTAGTVYTMPGSIIGTLDYMAPEQARGEPADERTDIYAFGLIFYEMLAGGRPRSSKEGGGLSDLLARMEQGPPPIRSVVADLPVELERIVSKCLKASPAERYATADELLADLDALDADGRPRLTPARWVPKWTTAVAAAAVALLLVAGTWWMTARPAVTVAPRDPVPVLIVDFDNRAQEPVFDGALEQALSIAMEGAPFITAFPRREASTLVRNLKFGDKLDDKTGRLVATREGIRVILAGAIERDGGGYRIAVRAFDPEKPDPPVAVATAKASEKGDVLGAVGEVAEQLRKALGDRTPTIRQNAETFTTASLDAIREYTVAQDLSADQKDEEAIPHYQAAIKSDPDFGRAYAGLATSLHYQGRREDAAKAWEEALKRLDRMSERERLRTMGVRHALARNSQKAIEAYEDLVTKYPADSAAHNNLAVTQFSQLNFAKALEQGQLAIKIYPKSFKYRANYALYAMYAGDFKTAGETARMLVAEDKTFATAYLPLAMEALAAGDVARARAAYEQAAQGGATGASLAAIGLADLALYEGRYDEAARSLPDAIARDTAGKDVFGAIAKLLALAEAHAARGDWAAAQNALGQARGLADDDNVLVTTARLSIGAGQVDAAKKIAAELGARLPAQSRAYGKLIEAELLMAAKPAQIPAAIDALTAAKGLADLWLVRYVSGLAYLQGGDAEAAASEFAKCQERRGEATAIFLDDLPTFRYLAPLPYWLGRAREASKLDPRSQYEAYLAIRGGAAQDPLVVDAKRRLEAR
jgi:tetratricopeptide (TPR) repeat protein/tRNA A-37 threonylcarbamoyl transferase component Bud32